MDEITDEDYETIAVWEKKKDPDYRFDSVHFFSDSNKVEKIVGAVKVTRRTFVSGIWRNRETWRRVRWDAIGHCHIVSGTLRLRKYDIALK